LLTNEIGTSLGWLVAKVNAFGEMVMELLETVIGHLHLSSINLAYKVFFLFLHVMDMLGKLVVMRENVMIVLGGKITMF